MLLLFSSFLELVRTLLGQLVLCRAIQSCTFDAALPEAYERLLMDIIRGKSTLFMRRDEVEAAWAWCEPIARAWAQTGQSASPYVAGSYGPVASANLIHQSGRKWHEDDA